MSSSRMFAQYIKHRRAHVQGTTTHSSFVHTGRSTFSTLHGGRGENDDKVLVIGSGVAGCSAALIAAEKYKLPVKLICAGESMNDCNSYWAQGGIIYKNYDKNAGDSSAKLVDDIQRAGAGLCDFSAVNKVATEGPKRVRQLLLDSTDVFANCDFTRDEDDNLLYCLEASHSAPRILYKADHSGAEITKSINHAVANHPKIEIVHSSVVSDLIVSDDRCLGVEIINKHTNKRTKMLSKYGTVLASGGLAGIFKYSTNPMGFNAIGSSTALASRANVALKDLEYVQFHPTALNVPGQKPYLLTEALRGCGAKLVCEGVEFAEEFHPDGELAPRDIVARGVYSRAQDTGSNVFLDISHRGAEFVKDRFPSIRSYLMQHTKFDVATMPVPITPAAHYSCGGIKTDLNAMTSLKGLYAAGESMCSGLHGGNRLASTSLLEGLVFGAAAADHIGSCQDYADTGSSNRTEENISVFSRAMIENNERQSGFLLQQIREIMWNNVGIVRTESGMDEAIDQLHQIQDTAESNFHESPTIATVMVRDASQAALCVTKAAEANKVSAGAHYVVDEDILEDDQPIALQAVG